jgi:dienelactone hydrolase
MDDSTNDPTSPHRGRRTAASMAHRTPRAIRRLALVLLVLLMALLLALVLSPYQPLAATGPYRVATTRSTYTDSSRIEQYSSSGAKRRVNVSFWYPQNAGVGETFPLVVFSHGGLGTEDSNESLYLELASHGYVVASIGHPYHALWTKDEGGRTTFVNLDYFQELQQEDPQRDRLASYRLYQQWMATRMGDIGFVIDTILDEAANDSPGAASLVDGTRIGVMGHSLGGSAALGIARQRDDIDAVIALESPFLYDIVGVENGEFVWSDESYPVPVLNVYSDSSWSHLAQWPQYARNAAWLADGPETAVNLHLPGGGHFALTDLSLASPLLTRVLEGGQAVHDRRAYLQEVNRACLEFFERTLGDPDPHKR